MLRRALLLVAVVSVALSMAAVGRADPLNPLDFPSLGVVTLPAGSYTIDTGATPPTISGPVNLVGTSYGSGSSGIAVFSFDELTIPAGLTITVTGSRMLAILSAGDLNVASPISVDGGPGGEPVSAPGLGGIPVAGGGAGGAGGAKVNDLSTSSFGGWGNGRGGGGGAAGQLEGSATPGVGGVSYGNLLRRLEGGSGGGGGNSFISWCAGAGAGGGALELGALGTMNLSANLSARGGVGPGDTIFTAASGGGSGGGILLHAATLVLPPSISATGGDGGSAIGFCGCVRGGGGGGFGGAGQTGDDGSAGGGGGGGGIVTLQSASAVSTSGIDVLGGAGGGVGAGADGIVRAVQVSAVATDLEFGAVPVGSSKTLGLLLQSTGDEDTCINGAFPATASSSFARVGDGVFSSLRPGRYATVPYTFAPTAAGAFSETVTIISNAGPIQATLSGTGVYDCPGDIDGDGVVDLSDLGIVLVAWGAVCP